MAKILRTNWRRKGRRGRRGGGREERGMIREGRRVGRGRGERGRRVKAPES